MGRLERRRDTMDAAQRNTYLNRQRILRMTLAALEAEPTPEVRNRAHIFAYNMTDLSPDSQSSDGEYPRPDEEPEAELRSEDGYFNEHNVPDIEAETGEEVAETGIGESADVEMTESTKRTTKKMI